MVIEAIHDLVADPVESDHVAAFSYLSSRWKRRSLLVCFTDVESPEDAKELTAAFGPMVHRHVALFARVSDPRLKEASEQPIHNLEDMYLRASALTFLKERQEVETSLSSAGLYSLEAEPQDLAAALVSFYFEAKEKALI